MPLTIRPKEKCRWDLVSLGEVMLRFDPGERRICVDPFFRCLRGRRRIQRGARVEALLRTGDRHRLPRWPTIPSAVCCRT